MEQQYQMSIQRIYHKKVHLIVTGDHESIIQLLTFGLKISLKKCTGSVDDVLVCKTDRNDLMIEKI